MTLLRREIESAAFWDRWVCLDCEEVVDAERLEGERPTCGECGGETILPAEQLHRWLELVLAGEE